MKSRITTVARIIVTLAAMIAALAPASAKDAFLPPAPGGVVQTRDVAFNGESANDRWRAVVSKKLAGAGNGREFYQWYLSIYALRRGVFRLRYQSPGNGGPLARVTQANGAKMWFPVQELRIVGSPTLMRPGVQQLVVQSHEMAADCGSATVTVFASGPGGSVVPAATVENPCDLNATIVRVGNGDALELTGPYYAPNAALCCPKKPHATAVLRFRDGRWVESSNYFTIR